MKSGVIKKVAGPLVIAEGMKECKIYDLVYMGENRLLGEIIEMHDTKASIQVYEDTSGLGAGDIVESTDMPLCVELGPGLIGSIYDGIQRPLDKIMEKAGDNLSRGISVHPLDRTKKWEFSPVVECGDKLCGGDIIGIVSETHVITHKIMLPPHISGYVDKIYKGAFSLDETVAVIKSGDNKYNITLSQKWPIRKNRPYIKKLPPSVPLITGQRVIDMLFPIVKGGVAAIPGPFGSGKTVVQHQLAKWADADIIVYIGCGERGNEMTDVLNEFPSLYDTRNNSTLMERTVLIANTSDMPVAAREASIYTGITIAEYYRDMGYSVALMADSTSRWAEALREMSGRLEEMPGEEGYPAYLESRLAQFYERGGRVEPLASGVKEGTLTLIGAVSPPGGDITEPVSQATLRIVKVFWGLDSSLAYKRHFPAINWLTSYSLYTTMLDKWYKTNIDNSWDELRGRTMRALQEEAELDEILKMVGMDVMSENDKLKLKISRIIREDFLHQNAFHEKDTYTPLKNQFFMLKLIFSFYDLCLNALNDGQLDESCDISEKVRRIKYSDENHVNSEYLRAEREIKDEICLKKV